MITNLLAVAGEAAPQNQFGFMEAMEQGGIIAWSIFTVLVIMSVGSFYILFTKLFEQRKIMSQYDTVRSQFWRANTLDEGAKKLDSNSAWRQLVDDAVKARETHTKMGDNLEAHDWLHGSLARSEASINARRRDRAVRRPAGYGYRYLPRAHQHRPRRFGFDRQGRRPGR